jgi:hypothetical protein
MPRPSTRALPEFGHVYGLPGIRDPEGVGKLTSKWNAHKKSD